MSDLIDYRNELDIIDGQLVKLFLQRLSVTRNVALYKEEHGLPVLDSKREEEKIAAVRALCDTDEQKDAAEELFTEIMRISRKQQNDIIER